MTAGGRPGGRDEGSSLALALFLVTFLGLVMGSLLSYSSASIRATRTADDRAARTYDADGALQTAVNQVRTTDFNNDPGRACPALDVPGSDGTAVRVTCTAAPGTGGAGERVPTTAANTPGQAVLTLGTEAGETGIAQRSAAPFRVQGKVFSSGPVTTGTGTLESVDSAVVARGPCSGTVISRDARGATVPTVCPAPAAAVPTDPGYPQPTAGLIHRALPVCGASSTVEFVPGYYDDAVGLSDMMDGTGPCTGKTFLFPPAAAGVGVYYFDFHNGEGGGLPAGPRVWTVEDPAARLVGGTPLGWVPDASVPELPGACVSPLSATANRGVRFVFGGDSRLRLAAGAVELCGQYSTTSPPVALQGATTGADTVTGPLALAPDGTGDNPTDGPAFGDPARITATDGNAATAVLDGTGFPTGLVASVIVTGYAPPDAIPAGSVLTRADLLVVHRDNTTRATDRLAVLQVSAVPTRAGAPVLPDLPQPTRYQDGTGTDFHTDTLDLLPALAAEVHDFGFTGLRVRYDAGVAAGDTVTEHLDSLRLVLGYRLPAVRGESTAVDGAANCVGAYPGGCPLLETVAGRAVLAVQGTVSAPYAAVVLRLDGVTAPVVGAGLVVRAAQLAITPRAGFDGPLLEVPSLSDGPLPLEVLFRAYRSGTVVATARVRYPAADPTAPPTAGRRAVTVLSWSIRRG